MSGITGFARIDTLSSGKLTFGFGLSESSCRQLVLIPIVQEAAFGGYPTAAIRLRGQLQLGRVGTNCEPVTLPLASILVCGMLDLN